MNIVFGERIINCDAIAFDKDGTLIDSHSFWWGLYESRAQIILSRVGRDVLNNWTRAIGVNLESNYINPNGIYALGSLQEEVTVLALCICDLSQIPWNEAIIKSRRILYDADKNLPLDAYTRTLPGVPDVLIQLHEFGVPLAVVTQDQYDRSLGTINYLGMQNVIKTIITPSEVEHSKPAPDMLLLTAEHLGVDPNRMVMVGDSVVDMEMACSAGAIPVYLTQDRSSPKSIRNLSATIISSISEIKTDISK
jgi:HAD superfamily hydrolase (TIGR01549 family)